MKKKVSLARSLSQRVRKPARVPHPVQNKSAKPEVLSTAGPSEEERWQRDMATLRRAAEDLAKLRSERRVSYRPNVDQFDRIASSVIECTDQQRSATIRRLYSLDPERAASFLNIFLQGCSREERQQIGAALDASGLVGEAIKDLTGRSHSNSYRAYSLLFLVAKAGTIGPLMRVIEDHPNIELRLALIRLLSSSGGSDLIFQFQHLLTNASLPIELSAPIKEIVRHLRAQPLEITPSAA
ncbi:MAG TPA: hypothetical protein VL866_03095 [Pyrinomonadaceae bacterium]|nr:hypothetical protein [Pyrinomonadaceae bacterium]